VEFLCGGRALRAYRALRDAVAGSIRALSVLPHELPDAIAGAQAENKQLRKTIRDLTEALAVHEAQTLAARGVRAGSVTLVAEALEGWDANGLKALATSIAARPGHAAVLLTRTSPVLVVVARAADTDVDAGAVLKALVARFGGKGGGRADLAQGGGLAGDSAAIVAAARALVAGTASLSA
jgi:alanyl-tRNA synthetase